MRPHRLTQHLARAGAYVHSATTDLIDRLAGTSPLYTFAGIFADESLERTPENFIGAQ